MTHAELAQLAYDELALTTVTFQTWKKKVKQGVYDPPDGSSTHWGKAFAALCEITLEPPA